MGILKDRKPIESRQLCAIARMVILRDPAMPNSEWRAGISEVLAKGGWEEPSADIVTWAMGQVERALERTMGPRPIAMPTRAQPAPKPEPSPLTQRDWAAFAATLRKVFERTDAITPQNVVPIARQTLDISEHAAMDQFYAECAAWNRLDVLRRFAEIAITRPADWDPARIRAESGQHALFADRCFSCRARARTINWHHVIQIQHGGSNLLRNRVALCDACHADIHPWLPAGVRSSRSGWTNIGGLVPGAVELLRRLRKQEAS